MRQLTFKVENPRSPVSTDNRDIGSRVKAARVAAGFTQTEVAARLNLSQPAINMIERGENSLTLDNLFRLSEILGRDVAYFLGVGAGSLEANEVEWLQFHKEIPPEDRPTIVELLRGYVERLRRR